MEARMQRGMLIAATCRIGRQDGVFLVPSQTMAERRYAVNLEKRSCECPDCQEGGFKCKHLFAVEITLKRELGADGSVSETRTLSVTEKKVYRQDWAAYNHAQATEKPRFQVLLKELCKTVPEREFDGRGRKPHTYRDSLFAMAYKVYSTFSSRRFSSDLLDAYERGHLSRTIPGIKVNAFFENPVFTPILKQLIARSAAPLREVETDFAVDSSGFSTSKFERWFDAKYGETRQKCVWVKAHIAVGVKTNVITAVRILDKDAGDSPQFKPLVKATAENFTINEVSGDKAYASLENFEAVAECGGTGFIAFKENATGGIGGLFEKMLHYFRFRQGEFLDHYHKRSNVESTFSAIKRKFGDAVRAKTDVAMVNEVLCKFLCFNLCVLIQEQEELGIAPVFWGGQESASDFAIIRA